MQKQRVSACVGIFVALLVGAVLFGCGSSRHPRLIVLDDTNTVTNTNVFNIGGTGGLTAVVGSAFDLGTLTGGTSLSDPNSIVIHPNGRWIYAGDTSSTIESFSLDANGKPVVINKASAESGNTGAGSMAVTPNGMFLYTADDNQFVSVFSINQTTGAVTWVSDFDSGLNCSGGITATNTAVYVNEDCGFGLVAATIGGNGSLTLLSSRASCDAGYPIQVDQSGKYLYLGGSNGICQYTLAANGDVASYQGEVSMTGSFLEQFAITRDNKFLYAADDGNGPHAYTINSNGTLTEITGSPFNALVVDGDAITLDQANNFLYVVGETSVGPTTWGVYGFSRNPSTGALTDFTTGNPIMTANPSSSYALAASN